MSAEEDDQDASYYSILNVPRDASQEEIKRAYRSLAQVVHPDKHATDDLRLKAQATFARLQEAHEVLSDPVQRQIYDVYGREGLRAGLEVGSHLSRDDLKRRWEEFREQAERERQARFTQASGYYICRLDAVDLVHGKPAPPQIRAVLATNSINIPGLFETDAISLQGTAALRGHVGSGSVICGYSREISNHDTLQFRAVLGGLKNIFSVSSTRQLSPHATATAEATWSAADGAGLTLSTTRQLTESTNGTLSWVVGPAAASGLLLNLTHKGEQYVATGKLELGASTALSAKLVYFWTPQLHLQAAAKLGLAGGEVELGVTRIFSPHSKGYMGTAVGRAGITGKVRFSRGGHTFDFPVMLSTDYADWRVLAGAALLPPAASLLVLRGVVRPLSAWQRRRRERALLQSRMAEVQQQRAKAQGEAELLQPVGRRKAVAEAKKGGLVIVEAAYGNLEGFKPGTILRRALQRHAQQQQELQAAQQQQERQEAEAAALAAAATATAASTSSGHSAPADAAAGGASTGEAAQPPSTSAQHDQAASAATQPISSATSPADATAATSTSSSAETAQPSAARSTDAAASSNSSSSDTGPSWVDVTATLQYMVADSRLTLHETVPRQGIMGFADVAPGADKQLYVGYVYGGHPFTVTVAADAKLDLPGMGEPVSDLELAKAFVEYVASLASSDSTS